MRGVFMGMVRVSRPLPSLLLSSVRAFDVGCLVGVGWLLLMCECLVDLQCMGNPRYVLGMDFIEKYRIEVGASEPKEDFYDRHDLYAL